MAEVRPFIGLTYNREVINNLKDVISPPFDTIPPELHKNLYDRHLYNIVRLELPSGEGEEKYINAGKILESWIESRILVPAEGARFYLYKERYILNGEERVLRGLFGAVRLEPFDKRVILPHELTFPKPKEDRLNLLRATGSNISPILGIYFDDSDSSNRIWEDTRPQKPLFEDEDFSFWEVKDDLEGIVALFEDKVILIADGHHRYETALEYKIEMESRLKKTGPYSFVMFFLVEANTGGLSLLPTHRVIKGIPEQFDESILKSFHLEEVERPDLNRDENICYLYRYGKFSMFRTESLNVVSLHKFLETFSELTIHYTHNMEEALSLVDSGGYDLAFIVTPPSMDTVRKVVEKGDRLPHKSTYFYPKIGAGLVLYNHNLNLEMR